ncbi:MAG: hypothetical protein ACI9C1_000158 [Candidatus Aldehydirespiratoraceae bacterium]
MADDHAPISPDDIRDSLRSIVGDAEEKAQESAKKLLPVAIGGGVLILLLAYLIGKRVGKTKSTVVEIRRI